MPEQAALSVNGMTCASCVAHVDKAARRVPGVASSNVNLARGRAVIEYDPNQTDPLHIAAAITDAGYPAAPEAIAGNVEDERLMRQAHAARAWFRRAVIGIVLWLPFELMHWLLHHPTWLNWATFFTSTISIVYVGAAFYRSAWKALLRRTSNMDTLIAMGASVAYVYSVVAFFGYLAGWWQTLPNLYFMEATGLFALISLGHWLEARARQSAGSAIRELLNLAPATALRLTSPSPGTPGEGRGEGDFEFKEVPVADLHINDHILARPGDRIATDGVVIAGESSVDESMLTGESIPVRKAIGDETIGGTLNIDGRLTIRVAKTGSETALAQIVKLVEKAQSSKPPVQRLADQVAAVFVPCVLVIALITAIAWYIHGGPAMWGNIAKAVCSVLIIACPCALGLAVPASLMVGTGRGARRGILIRDIDALQSAEKIDTVVLDKTGTITRGKPVVTLIQPLAGLAPDEILKLAASAEQFSEHPLAKAIVSAAREKNLQLGEPESFSNEPGLGVFAMIENRIVIVGNSDLMTKYLIDKKDSYPTFATTVYVAVDNQHVGAIELADEIKPDSALAILELHGMKLRTLLLTGDNERIAYAIAQQVGIDDVRANVKPGGKADVIRELQAKGSRVAMVGDGINDAPALAAADLGIAIGGGSDIAKETGDIVLVSGSLHGIATAIRLSRATMKKIRQNLFFAFVYNVLAIPLAALGLLNPLIAAGAMALSDVTVIGNALLLRRTKID